MSYSTFLAFFTSFGNSFDLATNLSLYRFCSSGVKEFARKELKGYMEQSDFLKQRCRVV